MWLALVKILGRLQEELGSSESASADVVAGRRNPKTPDVCLGDSKSHGSLFSHNHDTSLVRFHVYYTRCA
jgi:hypothetical protein